LYTVRVVAEILDSARIFTGRRRSQPRGVKKLAVLWALEATDLKYGLCKNAPRGQDFRIN